MKRILLSVLLVTFAVLLSSTVYAQKTCTCPCACPATPAPGGVSSVEPVYPGVGTDTRSMPVDMSKAPPASPPPASAPAHKAQANAYPPPPVQGGTPYSGGYTDLPKGWDDTTVIPPGAVRLEDVKPRYGTGAQAQSAPAAKQPQSQPQVQQQAPVEEETIGSEPREDKPPPSRWSP
jgi:hypothetical protein